MKNHLLMSALALLFGITSVYGQVNVDIVRPSVNATQFSIAVKIPSKAFMSIQICNPQGQYIHK